MTDRELQELVDAPEPEPVARVTGFYAGYLSIETVDGRVLPVGTALYTAPPAPSVPDGWKLVPVEPTPEMMRSGANVPLNKAARHNAVYRAMLAAAPTPAEAPEDVARDARLQVESEFAALLPGVVYMDEPDGGSPTVQEQIKRMARDAARYRWLLKQAWFQQSADRFDLPDGGLQNRFEKCMDEFIDAAMSKKGGA